MILHRVIDVFFRTLDAVDTARDQLERVLGRENETDPWAVPWPEDGGTEPQDASHASPQNGGTAEDESVSHSDDTGSGPQESLEATESPPTSSPAQKQAGQKQAAQKQAGQKQAAQKQPSSKAGADSKSKTQASPRSKAKKGPGRKKSTAANRKGSVDRSGKDVDSARARAIENHIAEHRLRVVYPDDQLQGKKVLARVVWALWATEQAGAKKGLTTKDISALLSACANIEVFTTNIGRACRDHSDLIFLNEPDGRSKRYSLTETGFQEATSFFEINGKA